MLKLADGLACRVECGKQNKTNVRAAYYERIMQGYGDRSIIGQLSRTVTSDRPVVSRFVTQSRSFVGEHFDTAPQQLCDAPN